VAQRCNFAARKRQRAISAGWRRVMATELNDEEIALVEEKLEALRVEHRDLDDVIARLVDDHYNDELQIRRLKRRKLMLKDQIAMLERQLVPDIPA
jgi:hypothetical protein